MPRPEAEFTDTDPRVLSRWFEILGRKSPDEKLAITFGMIGFALGCAEAGVRERHPQASEREIFLRAASLRIPRDLMIRAYSWDPEEHSL